MVNLQVIGTGKYLPAEVIPNSYFEGRDLFKYEIDPENSQGSNRVAVRRVGDPIRVTAEKIEIITGWDKEKRPTTTFGIKERRRAAPNEFPSDMGYQAALKAIEKAGIEAGSLVGILFATVTEDTNFPSAACKVQKQLGIRKCFARDIGEACAGFVAGLEVASSMAEKRPGNYLVIGAECLTKMVDPTDLNSTLFGDGAGAVVLQPTSNSKGILKTYSTSDSTNPKDSYIFRDKDRILRMVKGDRVLRDATRSMIWSTRVLKRFLTWKRELPDWKKVDVYVPHQANGRIINEIEDRVKSEGSVVFRNISKYGNMSTATCAVALDEAIEEGIVKEGSRVILVSFGSGLVTDAAAIQF